MYCCAVEKPSKNTKYYTELLSALLLLVDHKKGHISFPLDVHGYISVVKAFAIITVLLSLLCFVTERLSMKKQPDAWRKQSLRFRFPVILHWFI